MPTLHPRTGGFDQRLNPSIGFKSQHQDIAAQASTQASPTPSPLHLFQGFCEKRRSMRRAKMTRIANGHGNKRLARAFKTVRSGQEASPVCQRRVSDSCCGCATMFVSATRLDLPHHTTRGCAVPKSAPPSPLLSRAGRRCAFDGPIYPLKRRICPRFWLSSWLRCSSTSWKAAQGEALAWGVSQSHALHHGIATLSLGYNGGSVTYGDESFRSKYLTTSSHSSRTSIPRITSEYHRSTHSGAHQSSQC
jgi:hypothetical protein